VLQTRAGHPAHHLHNVCAAVHSSRTSAATGWLDDRLDDMTGWCIDMF
jgi:hypothetical protein